MNAVAFSSRFPQGSYPVSAFAYVSLWCSSPVGITPWLLWLSLVASTSTSNTWGRWKNIHSLQFFTLPQQEWWAKVHLTVVASCSTSACAMLTTYCLTNNEKSEQMKEVHAWCVALDLCVHKDIMSKRSYSVYCVCRWWGVDNFSWLYSSHLSQRGWWSYVIKQSIKGVGRRNARTAIHHGNSGYSGIGHKAHPHQELATSTTRLRSREERPLSGWIQPPPPRAPIKGWQR